MKPADILKVSFEFSPKLGIRELPELTSKHESNVSGLHIVGDLADAPIIKAALNQGFDVAKRVADDLGESSDPTLLDVVVVGAGPAGIGAGLALQECGSRYLIVEKELPFNTIQNFPKSKLIFSEPREMHNRGNFWFEDAKKETLVERWHQALEDKQLRIRQPEECLDIRKDGGVFTVTTKVGEPGPRAENATHQGTSGDAGATHTYRARRVILAVGRRGSLNRLQVPGEHLDKVNYALKDPDAYRGRRLLIVGGGDSAVESALACHAAGAHVTVAYRGDAFVRAKAKNREAIETLIASGQVAVEYDANPKEIREDSVVLTRAGADFEIANDDVLAFIGTKLPDKFLKRIGIRLAGEMTSKRAVWVGSFALMTYLFYVLKTKKTFFPFGPDHPLAAVPGFLTGDIGLRSVDGAFWGTVLYSLVILVFGIKARRKYPSITQKRRYIALIVFQLLFLFGIPEIIAPFFIERPWKIYALTVPWPLSIWSLIDAPSWAGGSLVTAALWVALGAIVAFVVIPLYVRWQGLRFCSYLCGCGGLAETLGDQWRHLAPRGLTSYKAEWAGRVIFLAAIPVTLLILNDAWALFSVDALRSTKTFAQNWYGLMVDFWLASVVGVAFYPYLGNRVWCRFFCPLRAWMEILARRFAKLTIRSNSKCIGCGECTRHCQMGIAVQKFAQHQMELDNTNSSCIQCGICVQVCPMEVLSLHSRNPRDQRLPILQPSYGPTASRGTKLTDKPSTSANI